MGKYSDKIITAQKKYKKLKDLLYKQDANYDKATSKAHCSFCEIYDKESKLSFPVRHKQCKAASACKKVAEQHKKCVEINNEFDAISLCYSQDIFDELSVIKPKLYHRVSKETVSWDKVFPKEFNKVIEQDLVGCIIALIELAGGKYRLK